MKLADLKKKVAELESLYRERTRIREQLELITHTRAPAVPVVIFSVELKMARTMAEDLLREAAREATHACAKAAADIRVDCDE